MVMRQWIRSAPWVSHVAVGLGYFLAYQLLRDISVSQWSLQAGLRLSCVLLLSRRYWPTLLLADIAAAAPLAIECLEQYGVAWSLSHLFPAIAFAMAPVWFLRKRLPGPGSGSKTLAVNASHMAWLLICATVLALFSAIDGHIQVALSTSSESQKFSAGTLISIYTLRQYLGCLFVAPLALMTYQISNPLLHSRRQEFKEFISNRLVQEGIVLSGISLGLLIMLGSRANDAVLREAARLGMLLPVAWLALRHGWKGAAVGGALASIGVMLVMPASYDLANIQAQGFIAVAISSMLMLGAQADASRQQEEKLAREYRQARQIARREVYQCELRLRRMSEVLERSHGELQLSHGRLLHRLRFSLSSGETTVYRDELQSIRQKIYRVVDSLSPRDWQKHDLPGALWNGPITQTLDNVGVAYHVKDPEGSLSELAPDLRLALFRLACEAVAYLLTSGGPLTAIHLRLRGGRTREGRGWAVLTVQGKQDAELRALGAKPPTRDEVQTWLGASGLDLRGMQDRASLYDGKVHARTTAETGRIAILLLDAPEVVEPQADTEPSYRLPEVDSD